MKRTVPAVVGLALLLPTCAGLGDDEVLVFAAASLQEPFAEIAAASDQADPQVTVALNHAGSQQLAGQIIEGAPADVFASADRRQMEAVRTAGLVDGEAVEFARNRLAVAVEPGNPLDVRELADLADPTVTLVLADPAVPAGRLADEALAGAGVDVEPASREPDVRAALSRVSLGEADAAIVYATDVATASDVVDGVAIPADDNVTTTYLVAVVEGAAPREAAAAFVESTRSPRGRAALRRAGFELP